MTGASRRWVLVLLAPVALGATLSPLLHADPGAPAVSPPSSGQPGEPQAPVAAIVPAVARSVEPPPSPAATLPEHGAAECSEQRDPSWSHSRAAAVAAAPEAVDPPAEPGAELDARDD